MLYSQYFGSEKEAEKDYERLQAVLAKLNMVTLEKSTFQTYGGSGHSSTLLGCPGAVELKVANWDRERWNVTLDLKLPVVREGK